MKYPDDFSTPAFPAGRFIAVSRFMAVIIVALFFLIICACGAILWVKKTQNVSPFLISINPNGERWTVVAHDNHAKKIPAYYVLQESLLNKFARKWFTISDNILENQANWAKCDRQSAECTDTASDDIETCAIYCMSDDSVFGDFNRVVLPTFSALESDAAATWRVVAVHIKPMVSDTEITQTGGNWRIDVAVNTGDGIVNFTGFATVSYDPEHYPKTLGYYVSEFNTYRMN